MPRLAQAVLQFHHVTGFSGRSKPGADVGVVQFGFGRCARARQQQVPGLRVDDAGALEPVALLEFHHGLSRDHAKAVVHVVQRKVFGKPQAHLQLAHLGRLHAVAQVLYQWRGHTGRAR